MTWLKDKLNAAALWVYRWVTVIAGAVVGLLIFIPDILNFLASVDLTPILPPAYAARIVAGIAIAKALAAWIQSRAEAK